MDNFIIIPDSEVRLLMCPIEMDNNNQLKFGSITTQYNYFNSLPSIEVDKATFVRHDNIIRFPACIDDILEYNYVMYKNTHYSDKWFYAFITRMEYVNGELTSIYIQTDFYQTYQFNLVFKPSFIEREHVNDDTIGLHTIPENLETGEYIYNGTPDQADYGSYVMVVGVSEDILKLETSIAHNKYNGIVSGLTYIALKTQQDVNNFIFRYNEASKIEAVYSLFMIPESFLPTTDWNTDNTGTINYKYVTEQDTPFDLGTTTIMKPTMLGQLPTGYKPVNNKLLTFPYCFLEVTNNAGTNVIYKYELFTDNSYEYTNTITFRHKGVISPGCSIKCIPLNYGYVSNENLNEAINSAKLPVGSWVNDVFTNWLTQNGVNIGLNVLKGIGQVGYGTIATGAGLASSNLWTTLAGAQQVTGGIASVLDSVASVYEHSLTPNQAEGNTNSSDIIFTMGKSAPTFYQKSIKIEYAKIIDNIFSMFGYRVNTVKIPNLTGRQNWNYIKTGICNVEGDIPQEALETIKNMFNNGITIWHNPNTFLDYSQNNNII